MISTFSFAAILFALMSAAPAPAVIVPAPPRVDGSAYLVMDHDSSRILVARNIDERVEPASLTKIMTVYAAAAAIRDGKVKLDDMVRVSEKAWRMGGSRMFLDVNSLVSVRDLLMGVIVQSGNDASVAVAEHVSGSEDAFADLMNLHARRLGMTGTNFTNSTGWPDENEYTTARDMALLTAALIREFPEIYSWHAIREFTHNGIRQQSRNDLLRRDSTVDGVKTGHTDNAGYCLVASGRRDNMRLISVVMGSEGPGSRLRATESLLNYVFRFFETRRLYGAGEAVAETRVWKGGAETLRLGAQQNIFVTVPRGSFGRLQVSPQPDGRIIAPVAAGEVRGRLTVSLDGAEVGSFPLAALEPVVQGSLLVRLKDGVRMLFR
jgi:D-alanyl-D-alanine carboxypeptidase (penicillin-binding protein 5/6)